MTPYLQYCLTFRFSLNAPASIEAVCDLLEEVVKLRPSLIQVSITLYALATVLHHCVWCLKALMQVILLTGMDTNLLDI